MVDRISGNGFIKKTLYSNKVEKSNAKDTNQKTDSKTPPDELRIAAQKQALLSDAQATQAAQGARISLAKNPDITLGLNSNFLNQDA